MIELLLTGALALAEPCADAQPNRRAYFGDTHIHTSWSLDASTRMGTRTTPDDAYRFAYARSGALALQPYDAQGKPLRSLRPSRPLDFAAVTDHAESFRIVRICGDEENPGADSSICRNYGPVVGILAPVLVRWAERLGIDGVDYCGPGGSYCDQAYRQVWQDTIDAATRFNKPCEFTTFNAYEWSGGSGGSNMHRNVIFATDSVPAQPISALEEKEVEGLWRALDEQCLLEDNCQALTIPHNMNLSRGDMFSATMTNSEAMTREVALQRQHYERLAEIMQQKGDSECYYQAGITEDELCDFEKLPYVTFIAKYLPLFYGEPENDSRYMREALREGLRIEASLGVNPFTPGFIGSTDTHISAAGGVEENNYGGHHGDQVIEASLPLDEQLVDRPENNPGGLAVLYAEENSRSSLFAAMQRREAYGTSGTRIGLRVFAGSDLPGDLCQRQDLVEQGYALGVPMGGVLEGGAAETAPDFVVSARQDPTGTPLERIQIIKGWLGPDGSSMEKVYDVARSYQQASVDPQTCFRNGGGAASLCAHWQDPEFEPGVSAWYYARVVEQPSCRWNAWQCVDAGVNCGEPATVPDHLESCCDANIPRTIQERAWSSPIWIEN